jgi:hypothetical protein
MAQRAVVILALYAGLTCWLTWPLAGHLTTHRPTPFPGSEFDPLYSAWALAWQTHALFASDVRVADANIYFPERGALFYGPVAFGAWPYFAPTFLLTNNPALAQNLLFVGSLALTATSLHLVVYAWTAMHAAALVAGVAFLANRWLIWTFVPTTPHLAVLLYFPLILWLGVAEPSRRAMLALFVILVLQCAVDLAYVAPAALAPVIVLGLSDLVRSSARARGVRRLLVAGAAAAVTVAAHARYLGVAARAPNLAAQTNWPRNPSTEWIDAPWGLLNFMSPLALPTLAFLLVGAAAICVARRGWLGSATEHRAAAHCLLWLVVGIAISLPLHVKWRGDLYALPHLALLDHWLPVGFAVRHPERLRVAALFGMTVLTGLAFAELARQLGVAQRHGRQALAGAAAVLSLLMYGQYRSTIGQAPSYGPRFPARYPLTAAPRGDSPVLAALRQHGGPTVEVPIPPRRETMPVVHALAMYRSIFHWQPLLNGYASYWPEGFPARMRLASALPDATALQQLRRETGLANLLVRIGAELPIDAALSRQRQPWIDLAARGGRPDLELVAADTELLLFRVMPADDR